MVVFLSACAQFKSGNVTATIESRIATANEQSRQFPVNEWREIRQVFHEGNTILGRAGTVRDNLSRPVAVAASAGVLYIVDADRHELIRYDSITGEGRAITDLSRIAGGEISDIYLYNNEFLLLADPQGQQVLKVDLQGRLMQVLDAPSNLIAPISISVDLRRHEILVADGSYDDIVVFTLDGEPIATLGERGMENGQFRTMTALAWSDQGLYVAMRTGGRVQVIDANDQFERRLDTEGMIFPSAIVFDRKGRAYISDLMSNNIRVYDGDEQIAVLGGTGVAPGRFQRITDMWIDQGILYVVDSLNGRIQSHRTLD
ncbi:MAG: hypothetical protein D6698_15215 [Gammaproteobacteria bacterium]|nr:MAG: hypothetical protein D6698_15215 [Gammaproteobacteria bacterium]